MHYEETQNSELKPKVGWRKTFYKLMNNVVFSKTLEKARNRVDTTLIRTSDEDEIRKDITKPTFVRSEIFNEDLMGIQNHTNVLLKKPILLHVGMCVGFV